MCPTDRPTRAPTAQAPPATFNLEHSEEAATFAAKKREFRGPLDHHHADDCEALRFFIAADISTLASSPANPERVHVIYTHNINAFVITVPIDYMQGITFGATKYFETEADTTKIHYVLTLPQARNRLSPPKPVPRNEWLKFLPRYRAERMNLLPRRRTR